MQPLFNRVFITPISEQSKTISGLSAATTNQKKGKVLYPGTGLPGRPMIAKEGDTILYDCTAGIPFTHNQTEGFFLKEEDILAIL